DPNSPIAGLPAGSFSPTIVDLDYDGRYDIVFGDVDGSLHSWLNLSKSIAIVVAPENDRPTIVNGNETFLPDIAEDSTGPLGDTGCGCGVPYTADSVSLGVTVTPVNDAPVPSGDPAVLAAVDEDSLAPAGQSVATIFGPAFANVDGDGLAGVAITGNSTTAAQGEWQYHDGSQWTAIATPDAA